MTPHHHLSNNTTTTHHRHQNPSTPPKSTTEFHRHHQNRDPPPKPIVITKIKIEIHRQNPPPKSISKRQRKKEMASKCRIGDLQRKNKPAIDRERIMRLFYPTWKTGLFNHPGNGLKSVQSFSLSYPRFSKHRIRLSNFMDNVGNKHCLVNFHRLNKYLHR